MMLQLMFALVAFQGVFGQSNNPACDESSCYPATGDLLIGRSSRVKASSTCGLRRPERFCIVSHLEDRGKCFFCDSRRGYNSGMSHRVENVVVTNRSSKWSWWQAANGKEKVSLQLDLEAEFHFTHLILVFKTFRPAAMLVERSYDFGKTWKVYRYFAYNCRKSFPGIRTGPIKRITDVICEDRYSDVEPSTRGEVIFRVLPPSIEIEDPYSEEVQDLLKMTNLRVNFTELHTLGDNLLDNRAEIKEKYYYSLYEMIVRGSCSCYGHASRCLPISGQRPARGMVYGRCECTHNTKGRNCQLCDDFFNDLPWRPARGRATNACKRCNCNNHATRCHFDAAVYEASGQVSGGVCDECQHNTMGRNCQECKPFFYHDPTRSIRDREACKPCDCDPSGSEHGGECESKTDREHSLVAGRCICKRLVEGPRCDRCKNGYWNMKKDNRDGCEACACNTVGTIGNYGCNKQSGSCRCKRYVTGRACDKCLPQYWGLSEDINGCKACDCDVGGAQDNACDQRTGQCNCRPNIISRQCNTAKPGFFITNLDYLAYEGEFATGTGRTRVVIREPQQGRPVTWTGPGFMRVSEGDSLEFKVDNLPLSMEYDVIIRYEPQTSERWDDVRVTVVRPGDVDQRGVCANSIPQDDFKAASLPPGGHGGDFGGSGDTSEEGFIFERGFERPETRRSFYLNGQRNQVEEWQLFDAFPYTGSRYYVVSPASCLERGVKYTIKLDFNKYKSDRSTPTASVLIDSILLVPNTNSIPIFLGPGIPQRMKQEFERYRCREQQLTVSRNELPEVCKKYIFSISAILQQKALDCDCDLTGSLSTVCDPFGGQCRCKPNVIGRRCDQCAPGTYGFGPLGCQPCNCHAVGSRDKFCDVNSGQCLCIPNAFGRQCDQCQVGYWGFPNCRPCKCNGRAIRCNNINGDCFNCTGNTAGAACDRCADGFYGDPRPGSTIGCRPCMCPGGRGSGYQHGKTCRLDFRTNAVQCDCDPGYTGPRCDRCDDNYFGNPLQPRGTCKPCVCNNNIDEDAPGNCDASTGECLKCLYNSEGFSCERCRPGYYGDATKQNCQACICNLLGTNRTKGPCDRRTGQCPCLAHVMGQRCDRCAPNFWKIASGLGCEACNCDPEGSLSTQCNEFDGQCRCKANRGGRTCSDCPTNHWGDPLRGRCYPCRCNQEGSETMQCDRKTGHCTCLPGVAGANCDHCARGTTGQLPNCEPCGECFNNWDRIINELKNETEYWVREGGKIKITGAPGAFDREFRDMESKLEEVKVIVSGANVTSADLDKLKKKLADVRQNLTASGDQVDKVDSELTDTSARVGLAASRIQALNKRVDALKKTAEELRKNATNIRELDVGGAYNSTKESQRRSQEAQRKVDNTAIIVKESERLRTRVEDLMSSTKGEFDKIYSDNEKSILEIDGQVNTLSGKITDINEMVCDRRGQPCDDLCGGGGCGKCGGLSCDEGAVTKSGNALNLANRAKDVLQKKFEEARNLRTNVDSAQQIADDAKADAQMTFDRAQEAKNISEKARQDLQDLISRITEYLDKKGARAADIRAVAEEVLAMSISLTPQQIRQLALQINETIKGLTDIDTILNATRDDLAKAQSLKDRADRAKKSADDILDTAQRVVKALKRASEKQNAAEQAITKATQDIADTKTDLQQIETETKIAHEKSNQSLTKVNNLKVGLDAVKKKFTENKLNVERAAAEADSAEKLAIQAEKDATDLETKYKDASTILDAKYNATRDAKLRAQTLKDRAVKLYEDTFQKIENLRRMEKEFMDNEQTLTKLSDEIADLTKRMVLYVQEIQKKAKFHRTCG